MKTLRELHLELRLEALKNDLDNGYARKMVAIELIAAQFGWDALTSRSGVEYQIQDIFRA